MNANTQKNRSRVAKKRSQTRVANGVIFKNNGKPWTDQDRQKFDEMFKAQQVKDGGKIRSVRRLYENMSRELGRSEWAIRQYRSIAGYEPKKRWFSTNGQVNPVVATLGLGGYPYFLAGSTDPKVPLDGLVHGNKGVEKYRGDLLRDGLEEISRNEKEVDACVHSSIKSSNRWFFSLVLFAIFAIGASAGFLGGVLVSEPLTVPMGADYEAAK